jgi:phenylacetate-CoA ligase
VADWQMELYWRLPVALQEVVLSGYAWYLDHKYYGADYEKQCETFRQWQSWTRPEIDAWERQRLRDIVELAGTTVPYYREQWRSIDWRSATSPDCLEVLPRLDKQAVRQNEGAFLVEGLDPKSLWAEKTSGTTGTSLRIYWPQSMLPKWWALVEVMVRNLAGVGQPIPRAMIGGRPIVAGNTTRPPYWRFNRRWRQLYLSAYHVSSATAPGYFAAIREYGSEWITGYGSAIAALAEAAREAGVPPLAQRTAIVSGDAFNSAMRHDVEQMFLCKSFDHYGQCEGVCMAMECRWGRMHLIPGVGIVEITRDDGTRCAPGEAGEIVATGLLNDAMPLIRYRLGDYAAWAADQHCPCGNANAIIESLEGRVDDYLVSMDGRRIGRLSTAMKRSPSIHSAQIVQDAPGHAFLLVRPSNGYRPADAEAVRDDILERVGRFEFDVVEVSDIPRTPQGKTALVVRLADRPQMKSAYSGILPL